MTLRTFGAVSLTSRNEKENKNVYVVALRGDDGELISYYEKHEYRSPETAELYVMIPDRHK